MKTPKELADAVRQYQGGMKKSFNVLYELSYPYLYTCIMHVMKDEEGTADMLQETYLEISQSIGQLRNAEDFLSWASTIGNHKCYARLKKQKEVLVDTDGSEDPQDFFESIADDEAFIPESILQDKEKQRLIREVIDGLSDMQRLCIIGFYYREQSIEEIAQELEVPANTVKSHLRRAKARIKDAVVALDREKGTRLYSIAPFMLLFLSKEAEACKAAPMPEKLTAELRQQRMGNGIGRMVKDAASGAFRTGMRYKLAAGLLLAAVLLGGGAILIHSANPSKDAVGESGAGITSEKETATVETEYQVIDTIFDGEMPAVESGMEMAAAEGAATTEQQTQMETNEPLLDMLVFDLNEYEGIGNACGGVIPVKKNGLWGAVNYNKEEIVPCSYTGFWRMPNFSGYFVLTDDTAGEQVYILFAPDGTKVYEGTDEVMASGNFYMVRSGVFDLDTGWEGTVNYYDYNGNQVLGTTYYEQSSVYLPVSGAFEGKIPVRRQYRRESDNGIVMEGGTLYADGTVVWDEEIYQEDSTTPGYMTIFQYPMGTPNHGYAIERYAAGEDGVLKLYTEGHQQVLWLDISQVSYRGDGFVRESDEEYDWVFFVHDGAWMDNYGSQMVWIMNGRYILVDLARADIMDDEGTVSSSMIQAVYDYIALDMNDYWLVQKGEHWGYIDHEGRELAMYDDASSFSNGYALVIESGNAYLINEKFETVAEYGPADSVSCRGELLGLEKDNVLSLINTARK